MDQTSEEKWDVEKSKRNERASGTYATEGLCGISEVTGNTDEGGERRETSLVPCSTHLLNGTNGG